MKPKKLTKQLFNNENAPFRFH